ncbi:MAG: PD-(D/E)XK nuclease family protein [Candidatus Omnitrophica bacterium]|nr:PD-(D/E)XK nuclease family protein [Candidatus Omnitrophota bacterium]
MAKTLLIGPAGCGKTSLLLSSFREYLQNAPDLLAPDGFFVVPSSEHTERVVSLLAQQGVSGFFHKRVTTLSDLVRDLFQVKEVPVVSSLTRLLIVKDLLKTQNWDYFRSVREQPGFPVLMDQFLTELKESVLLPEDFRNRMNALKGLEPAFAGKYEALAALYEQFVEELRRRGLRDVQDALQILRERKTGGGISLPRLRFLWLDGFFDFSNLQREYLKELCEMTEEVTVTLPQEDGRGWEDAFETVAGTRKALVAMGFEVREMKGRTFRARKPALRALQESLFSGHQASCEPDGITLLKAAGTEGEAEMIAREIHRLYATGGYRYSDFAVLFRQIKDYARVIAATFERYGIPVEIHERERLKFSSWMGAVASLLSLFRNGWRKEDLFDFLKSGHVRSWGPGGMKDPEWIEAFERRAFREGVTESREAWAAEWPERDKGGLGEFCAKKTAMLQGLIGLEDSFRAARTVEEHARILKRAVYETFQLFEVDDAYTSFARRDAACVRRFEALLDEIKEFFIKHKKTPVDFEAFTDHFLGLLELDLYSLHERDKNRVQIYDVSLARQKEYKVVFVAGLVEKVFPLRVREDPVLSDWERRLTNGGTDYPLGERSPRQSIEKLFFYFAVTRASEFLYLSHPYLDVEGKESLPSYYLEEVGALFNGRVPVIGQELSRPYPSLEEAITPREREAAVLGALRNVSESEALRDVRFNAVLGTVLAAPGGRARLLDATKPVEALISDGRIRKRKHSSIEETSATRLEEYAKCPYRYFADRVLNLKDPAQDTSLMHKGQILHQVIQRYFDPERERPSPEGLETFIRREIEEGLGSYPLIWSEPYREALDRRELFEMLFYFLKEESERLTVAGFKPTYVEYGFGTSPECRGPALEIRGTEQRSRLRGRVDRIDTDPEHTRAVVIDYKRSAHFKKSDLERGTALQLPLYLLAVCGHLKLQPFGGEIYSIRDRKRSGFYREGSEGVPEEGRFPRGRVPGDAFQEILDRALRFAGKFIDDIEALRIPVQPRDCESFCPYSTVCRIEKWKLPMIAEEVRSEDERSGILRANGQAIGGEKTGELK